MKNRPKLAAECQKRSNEFYKLMFVTNKQDKSIDDYLSLVKACVASGVTCVQLREKNASYESLITFGQALKKFLSSVAIPLIINDNLDLALALDADGVHLGQTDGDVQKARQRLGTDKIIGLSISSLEQLQTANSLPIDYVGCGAIFPTQNKIDITTIIGLEGLQQLASLSKHPMVAIGGINLSNAREVMQTGCRGIAAIGVFHHPADGATATQKLRQMRDEKDAYTTRNRNN
ncbi:MAG: thiamine phosphate synthase [Legionellales bacterium]|nr:thiamine phosphate synthase [Legionellales bacterium]